MVYAVGGFDKMRLWVYDPKLGVPNALTTSGVNGWPVWSPDGTRVAFARGDLEGEIYTMPADGSGQPKPVGPDVKGQPSSWSRDNVLAFLHAPAPHAPVGIWTIRMDGKAKPKPFVETGAAYPSFSPDGKWIAYASNETGKSEVYVRPFPAREPRQRISTAGGGAPVWSRHGTKLYFHTFGLTTQETILMEVDVTTEPKFTHTRPRELFRGKVQGTIPIRSYDIAPEGKRFVMLLPGEQKPQPVTRINIVQNWFDELKRLVPTK